MPSSDAHTERDGHLGHDRLVRLGAGAPRTAAEAAHLESCLDCRASVHEIELTLAPGTPVRPADPPDGLWDRIAAETGHTGRGATRGGRRSWPVRWIAAAAAVAGLAVGAGVTAVLVPGGEQQDPSTVATAELSVPAGTGRASGTATLVEEDGRTTLVVDTRGLVSAGGYFEVWLLDAAGRMYALGVLPESSTARLAVPEGISVRRFNIVDISAQEFNGDPSHSKDSVLRGTLG